MNLFPIVAFDLIDDDRADEKLREWGHWLGGCNRPFGRQSFGLSVHGELLCVAVSASTVNKNCGPWKRNEVVELVRLCSHPDNRDLTRPGLRLWRKVAAGCWSAHYWPVLAYVSYANAVRHKGDIYRFDGWRRVKDCPGGKTGPNSRAKNKEYDPKVLWDFVLEAKRAAGANPQPA